MNSWKKIAQVAIVAGAALWMYHDASTLPAFQPQTAAQSEPASVPETELLPETEVSTESESLPETEILTDSVTAGETEILTDSEPATETEILTETESETDAVSEAASEAGSETESETYTETEPESQTASETESETYTETESESLAVSETESETYAETETESASETESETYTETETESVSETEAESYAETESESAAESESEAYTETESESAAETESETYTETESESASEAESASEEETEPETSSEPLSYLDLGNELWSAISGYEGSWSIYVKDLQNGSCLTINSQPQSSASLIKLYIAGTILEEIQNGNLERTDTIDRLLTEMITVSDNEAANELVRYLSDTHDHQDGLLKVNAFAENHGFADTHQYNGLDDSSLWYEPDHINTTSVENCGRLFEEIYEGELISHLISREFEGYLLNQEVTWKIPAGIPSDIKTANKTGETDNTQNDVSMVFTPYGDYILCVMSADLTDQNTAIERIRSISGMVYEYFTDIASSSAYEISTAEILQYAADPAEDGMNYTVISETEGDESAAASETEGKESAAVSEVDSTEAMTETNGPEVMTEITETEVTE